MFDIADLWMEHSINNAARLTITTVHPSLCGHVVLPGIKMLTFVRERAHARPVVVAVGRSATLPDGVSDDGRVPGGRYCLSYSAPSSRLQQWSHAGARFDLSRLGTPCVWLDGVLHAVVQDRPPLHRLDEDERAYLDAYLTLLDRSRSDPDLPDDANL